MEDTIQMAAETIRQGTAGVALSGAGISAESGISTYRDPGGLWDRYREGATDGMLGVIMHHPHEAPHILRDFFNRLKAAKPNPGHLALAELEQMGYIRSVITQNIDNLHREAGNTKVYELHGNIYRLRCLQCGKIEKVKREAFFALAEDLVRITPFSFNALLAHLPRCQCSGTMRPDFVGFGERVQDLEGALTEALTCSWMMIVGTSGIVHPAASLPLKAKSQGAVLIEVNPKQSELSHMADIVLRGAAGDVLPRLVDALKQADSGKGAMKEEHAETGKGSESNASQPSHPL